jgi:ATP-dependent Clp protease ATP-binding subunit ClpC
MEGEMRQAEACEMTSNNLAPWSDISILDALSTDLIAAELAHTVAPIVGYAQEIERVIQILCRSRNQHHNPFLIGEPGPERRAIAEGLAQKIVTGNVPEMLLSKRILDLPAKAVVAGVTDYAQFAERLKRVIEETRQRQNCILFMEEFHTLVASPMDGSPIFRSPLARGEVQLIGAATLDQYRQYVEKDPALQRRFDDVVIRSLAARSLGGTPTAL